MNRLNVKQIILCMGGILACRFSWLDAFPLIPVYYTAVFLENSSRVLLTGAMLLGMALFVPVAEAARYAAALFVIMLTIRLFEWAEGRCTTVCAAISAGIATWLMSFSGMVLNVHARVNIPQGILEGCFVGAAIIPCRRMVDELGQFALTWKKETDAPYTRQRMGDYADSFSGLSRVFSAMSTAQKELSGEHVEQMQQELAGNLCVHCDQCSVCWEKKSNPMYSYVTFMLQALQRTGEPDEEIVVQMQEYCPYVDAVVQEAVRVFEKARLNLAWYNRLLENREIIAQQLDAMAYIMEDCANDMVEVTQENRKKIAEIRYRAKERGIVVKRLHLYEKRNHRLQLTCEAAAKQGGCLRMKELTKAVSLGLHKEMRPHREDGTMIRAELSAVTFEEDTQFYEMHGVARRTKDGGAVSGDNYSFLENNEGQIVAMLSDGMGSGSRACKESEQVLELLEKFLEAGFSKETALKMMNSAMVIKGEDDLYSTVDICSVDLHSGMCDIYKIGAAASFVYHENDVEAIWSNSLPVGVSNKMELKNIKKQLGDGDFLVMVSDGVLEYLQTDEPELLLSELIRETEVHNPSQMADWLLEKVLQRTEGQAKDDMTILVVGIWKR